MIKAIIFDCFGVLATDTWPTLRDKYFAEPAARRRIEQLRAEIDAGTTERTVFIDEFVAHTGLSAEELNAEIRANVVNDALLSHIATLKSTYKIGILSNVSGDRTHELFGERRALFDAIVLSCDIGVIKPHEAAFRIAAERLGVGPSECVFVDDRPENVAVAKRAGMKGIEYKKYDETIATLKELLDEN